MFKYVLENGLKANIWVNNFPTIIKEVKDELLVEGDTETYANSKQLVVELFIPRSHNNYALLGIDFRSDHENKVKVKMELLTKWPLKISNGNLSRKKDAHWRHFVFHINRFRFKAVAERRQ